ncbi:hypothetical protein [uncultured Demequina sp.]|uniref:hypothetical protein n=1 Tax=uncultured Demequina sp. TaxID=693499 RepID=UPI0025E216CC|nr:hypothetical protein [uncultured Demequina sp.]
MTTLRIATTASAVTSRALPSPALPSPVRAQVPSAPAADRIGPAPAASSRPGPVARLIDAATRRWMRDLYDVDLQLESIDLEADLRHGRD